MRRSLIFNLFKRTAAFFFSPIADLLVFHIAMPFDGTRLIYLRSAVRPPNPPVIRYASQYSAIRKGFLAERQLAVLKPKAIPSSPARQHARSSKTEWPPVKAEKPRPRPRPRGDDPRSVSPAGVSPDRDFFAQSSYGPPKDTKTSKTKGEQSTEHVKPKMGSKGMAKLEKKAVAAPHSLPFTTAASEFLYGHSAVIAALKANRRKLYKLYLHPRANKESGSTEIVEQLCQQLVVKIVHVDNKWLQAMDKVANGRPHNVRRS